MSTKFTVSKFPYDDVTVLVSDGKSQTGFYVGDSAQEGVITLEDFLKAVDVSNWEEDQLKLFTSPLFKDTPTGQVIGEFTIPATT